MEVHIMFVLVSIIVNVNGQKDNSSALELEKQQPKYLEFIDEDGATHIIDTQVKANHTRSSLIPNVRYLLYTRKNVYSEQFLIYGDSGSIMRSNFNPNLTTVVVVHGWHGSPYSSLNPAVKNAYLSKSDVNIIILDWESIAKLNYGSAVIEVPGVGQYLGRFLAFLNSVTNAPYSRMHLVGHSLGAHVVANAGRTLGGRVARVTGLDPAGPMWYLNTYHMKSSDGVYVEAIHTNGLGLGLMLNCADIDFYPNGGKTQPGCYTYTCNHSRSWQYFVASIMYDHLIGSQCSNDFQMTFNRCNGAALHMGNNDLYKSGSGVYRLNTRREFPY